MTTGDPRPQNGDQLPTPDNEAKLQRMVLEMCFEPDIKLFPKIHAVKIGADPDIDDTDTKLSEIAFLEGAYRPSQTVSADYQADLKKYTQSSFRYIASKLANSLLPNPEVLDVLTSTDELDAHITSAELVIWEDQQKHNLERTGIFFEAGGLVYSACSVYLSIPMLYHSKLVYAENLNGQYHYRESVRPESTEPLLDMLVELREKSDADKGTHSMLDIHNRTPSIEDKLKIVDIMMERNPSMRAALLRYQAELRSLVDSNTADTADLVSTMLFSEPRR